MDEPSAFHISRLPGVFVSGKHLDQLTSFSGRPVFLWEQQHEPHIPGCALCCFRLNSSQNGSKNCSKCLFLNYFYYYHYRHYYYSFNVKVLSSSDFKKKNEQKSAATLASTSSNFPLIFRGAFSGGSGPSGFHHR